MRKMPSVVALTALVALAGNAVRAEEAMPRTFKTLDTDSNGYISAQEAAADPALTVRWSELDADKDNRLDSSEFSAFEPGSGEMMEKGEMMKPEGMMKEGGMMKE